MRFSIFVVLVGAVALAGCTEDSPEPAETRSQAATQAAADDFDPEKERALKKTGQTPAVQKRVAHIDWGAAAKHPQGALSGLTAEQRAELADAPVPALVPERPELLDAATITGGQHWYAASLDGDAHTVYVSGTRLETVVPGLELAEEQPSLKDDFRITRTVQIVSLSFNAFGAAYVIEVECANPKSDPRCVKDDYVVELANALVLPEGGER